ncbi:MAG: SPFH domain-containing protein [Kordia sp.]|uniref:SPFH domain-containing protein n=1 Tax=Kordia sp. TaxID=1965332 RepID=UPI00385B6DF2
MNKKKIVPILSAFLMLLCISCDLKSKKEVFIKPSEIGVYYDKSEAKISVLNSGKQQIPNNVILYLYSLEAENIKDVISLVTKDGESIVCNVSYWFSLKTKNIARLHLEVGEDFKERIVFPKIRSALRTSFNNYNLVDVKPSELEKVITSELRNDTKFSEYIKTKSFKLKIESEKE